MFCPAQECNKVVKMSYLAFFLAIVVLIGDQLSKYYAYHYIPDMGSVYSYPYGGIPVFKNLLGVEFSINFMTNTGAAWGFFGDYQVPLIIVRIGLILATFIYLFFYNQHFSWQLPLCLILAGAIGNVIDYFNYGYVVDMFHFVIGGFDFPVFNVADSAISIGIGILLLLSWLEPKPS